MTKEKRDNAGETALQMEYALEALCTELTEGYNKRPEDPVIAELVNEALDALAAFGDYV
jgi:hypothetical protein|tara:strand:+ start:180 stop:356 length:177 start_codon:yes stop_codon:yes gene_type:complete